MSGIFISYRRKDTAAYARDLNEVLSRTFSDRQVFIDIHDLQRGLDFAVSLERAVASTDVLLALIGPHWLTITDAAGRRRLDDSGDHVRHEIAAALARNTVRVIPVLVGNASMPHAEDLPDDLKPLAHRHAIELSDERWDYDLGVLVDDLTLIVAPAGSAWPDRLRRPAALAVAAGVVVMALVATLILIGPGGDDRRDAEREVVAATVPTKTQDLVAATGETPLTVFRPGGWVAAVAFTPDGARLVSGGDDGTARIWDLARPEGEPTVLRSGDTWVTAVAVSPDGALLATGAENGTIRLWDVANPDAAPVVLSGHGAWVNALAFGADGSRLVSGADDGTARIWTPADPAAAPLVLQRGGSIMSVAFSPDGRYLATGADDGAFQVVDLTAPDTPVVARVGWATAVAWSADGSRVAGGNAEGTIRVWDPAAPDAEPIVLDGHEGQVRSVAFSPDGALLASGGDDGTARLWRMDDPDAEPIVLERRGVMVPAVAFSPDGKVLVSGGGDGVIRLWDVGRIAPGAE